MRIEGNHMIADEGKILRRIVTGEAYGNEIWLGYSHYIGGVKQELPHLDIPEDFEEIDAPIEQEEENEEDLELGEA